MPSARHMTMEDGAYKSRKFHLTLLAIALLTVVSLAGVRYPNMVAILPTFVGGLLGVLSLYFTGNVMNKYIVGKTAVQMTVADPKKGKKDAEAEGED